MPPLAKLEKQLQKQSLPSALSKDCQASFNVGQVQSNNLHRRKVIVSLHIFSPDQICYYLLTSSATSAHPVSLFTNCLWPSILPELCWTAYHTAYNRSLLAHVLYVLLTVSLSSIYIWWLSHPRQIGWRRNASSSFCKLCRAVQHELPEATCVRALVTRFARACHSYHSRHYASRHPCKWHR